MAKDYLSLPLRELLADTAAKSPTPGGGSVAAAVGALAASLARMAVEYTVGKPKFAAHDARLRELLTELGRAGEMFGQLMAEDMAAYERFAAARQNPDAAEKQRAIATATAVPMEIAVVAGALLERLDEIKAFTNPHLLSDLKAAAILAEAAAQTAALNVRENLRSLANTQEAGRLETQLHTLLARARGHRDAVVQDQASGT